MTVDDPGDDPELDEIARAFGRLADRPDPAVRAEHLRLAQAEFARMHGAAPVGEGWARRLWSSVAGPGAVGALTAAAAVGFVVLTPAGRGLLTEPFAVEEAGPREVPAGQAAEAEAAAVEATGTAPVAEGAETTVAPEAAPGTEATVAATAAESPPAKAPEVAAIEPAAPPAPAEEGVASAPEAARTLPAPGTPSDATRSLAEGAEAPAADAPADAAPAFAEGPPPVEDRAGGGGPEGAADLAAGTGALVALAPSPSDSEGDAASAAPAGAAPEAAAMAGAGMADLAGADPVREALEAGRLPAPGEVRVADLLRGAGVAPEAPEVLAAPAPWDPEAAVVTVLLPGWPGQAPRIDWAEGVEARPLDPELPEEGPLPADRSVMAWEVRGAEAGAEAGTLRFRGPIPFAGEAEKVTAPIAVEGGPRAALAAAIAGWALLLRGEDLGAWRAGDAVALAQGSPEAARLMRLSEPLLAR